MTASPSSRDLEPRLLTLRARIHEELIGSIDFSRVGDLSRDSLRAELGSRIESMLGRSGERLDDAQRTRLTRDILDEIFGLGPLEPLFADPDVTDIMVTGPAHVYVERLGRVEPAGIRFRDAEHLLNVVQRIVRNAGRRLDERSPMVDARLPDGSRVNAIIPPVAIDGPQLSIRRFSATPLDFARLAGFGTLSPASVDLLRMAVAARLNIVVTGGAGVGKTTLLNAMSDAMSPTERIVTIEDAAELRLLGEHVVRLETRPPNLEGIGRIDTRQLVRNALRMRPDRILVGECRGAESFDMLQAMNTGHEGAMTTLHANSARDAMHRLESLLAIGGFEVPVRVLRDYIASALHLVVHLARLPDGRRVVSEIVEVGDFDGDLIQLHTIHRYRLDDYRDGVAIGGFESTGHRPAFESILRQQGLSLPDAVCLAGPLPDGADG